MLFYALCCVSVIFMALTFSAIFGRRFEETAALAVITEALLLFAAGYIKHLSIGVIGVIAISAVGMIVSVCVQKVKLLQIRTASVRLQILSDQ